MSVAAFKQEKKERLSTELNPHNANKERVRISAYE